MDQPFDDNIRTHFRDFFIALGCAAFAEFPVFSKNRRIDLVIAVLAAQLASLAGTLFDYFGLVNALELKGPRDPLTLEGYNRIMMRAWGLGSLDPKAKTGSDAGKLAQTEAERLPENRTVTIICVIRPNHLLDDLGLRLGFAPTGVPGIYANNDSLKCRIIVPSELPLERKYYPALPLAKGAKLERFIEKCIEEGEIEYLTVALETGLAIDPAAIWRRMMEKLNMRTGLTKEAARIIDASFQKDPSLMLIFPTLRQMIEDAEQKAKEKAEQNAARDVEQRVQQLTAAVQRQAAEAARQAEETARQAEETARQAEETARQAEETARQAEETARQASQRIELEIRRDDLVRLLTRKFGELPGALMDRIQSTSDASTVREWFDRALDSSSLSGLGIE